MRCAYCPNPMLQSPEDHVVQQVWSRLEETLLNLGGQNVVWPGSEPELAALVTRGCPWEQSVVILSKLGHRFPQEAALLWASDPQNMTLVTGYGLGEDGCWRQHSWVIARNRLCETDARRQQYFGVSLTEEEAVLFWFRHILERQYPTLCPCSLDLVRKYPLVEALMIKMARGCEPAFGSPRLGVGIG
jgi:hypothetical protein